MLIRSVVGRGFKASIFSAIEIWAPGELLSIETSKAWESLGFADTLINSANSKLIGTSVPYFPRGGPFPEGEQGMHSMWGGMEVGDQMVYPTQCCDGRVHSESGNALVSMLQTAFPSGCGIGRSVMLEAIGNVASKYKYKYVIHTVPPLSNVPSSGASSHEELLMSCYTSSFDIIYREPSIRIVSTPLVGAGTAGFGTLRAAIALRNALSTRHELESMPFSTEHITINSQSSYEPNQVPNVSRLGHIKLNSVDKIFRIILPSKKDVMTVKSVLFCGAITNK